MKFIRKIVKASKAPSFGGKGGSSFFSSGPNNLGSTAVTPAPLVPFGSLYVAAGDSITDNGNAFGSSISNTIPRGYWTWAATGSNGRLLPALGCDAGVSGNNAAQLLARYDTDVIAKNPKVVFLLIGTNDVTNGRTSAQILADIDAIVAKNRAIGAITIQGKILPRNSVGSPMTGPQIATFEAVNNGLTSRAAADWIIWDAEPTIGAGDAAHTILTGMTTAEDKLHPNSLCAQRIGLTHVAPIVNALVPSGDSLFISNDHASNYIVNGFMTGTTGAKIGVTGDIATGWTADNSNAGGATIVASKISRASLGEWQRLVISGTYTGSNKASFIYRSRGSLSIPSGSVFRPALEVRAANLTAITSIGMAVVLSTGSMESYVAYSGETSELDDFEGTIIGCPFQCNATITSVDCYLKVSFRDTATTDPVAGTVDVGRVEVRLV